MKVYLFITFSLIIYPIVAWFISDYNDRFSTKYLKIIFSFLLIDFLIIFGLIIHIITISFNLNWFLFTSIYFTVSFLLFFKQKETKKSIKVLQLIFRNLVFGSGYLISTIGFLFILIGSYELEPVQYKWLSKDLLYIEQNIGSGPDPSISLKKIEIYKKVRLFPILCYRIEKITYDDLDFPLQRELELSFSNKNQILYLRSRVNGYKVFKFLDSIVFLKKYR